MATNWSEAAGRLTVVPASQGGELLAEPVERALGALDARESVGVAEIDPDLADTAAFCAEYGSPLELSANCVVVSGKRTGRAARRLARPGGQRSPRTSGRGGRQRTPEEQADHAR